MRRDTDTSHSVIPLSLNRHVPVTEFQPFLHRATPACAGLALDPTYPKSTNVASETLRIRHEGFSPSNATYTGILTSCRSTLPYGRASPQQERSPTNPPKADSLSSALCLSLDHLWRRRFHPVSCYAFFKGWLLLSQPPGCLKSATSFPTEQRLRGLRRKSGLFPSRHTSLAPHV